MHQIKKRYITLIEIMIVMFLIALITGVVAYNYRGSLEEGKVFKTKIGIEKLENILNLRAAGGVDPEEMRSHWKDFVRQDPLVKDADALIKDGWGKEYDVFVQDNVIRVRSESYDNYRKKRSNSR